MSYKAKKIIVLLGDLLVLWGALALTLLIRYGRVDYLAQFQIHWPRFIFIFLVFLLSFYINHLYNLNISPRSSQFLKQFLNSLTLAGLISIIYFYISISSAVAPKTNLFIFLAIFFALFYLWRFLSIPLQQSFRKTGVAILYDNHLSREIEEIISASPALAYSLKLIISDEASLAQARRLVAEGEIKMIIISGDFNLEENIKTHLMDFLKYNVGFLTYTEFLEMTKKRVPLDSIEISWFLNNFKEENRRPFQLSKRVFDLSLASLLFVLSAWLWPIIALAIKLDSQGPVIFKQERLGYRMKIFTIFKFRSMRVVDNNYEMTREGDSRITKVGAFLRKTRLDEIPQLINIIKGEMSFIGPRPERPELAKDLEKLVPFYLMRTIVKPGLSGWDQVSGEYHSANQEDTIKKLENDLYYIKHRSLFLDLIIILKTIGTILGRGGR